MSVHHCGSFRYLRDLVRHPTLEPEVKRAILASWAADAFAVRSNPALRRLPELAEPIAVRDVLDAVKGLDGDGSGVTH